MRKTILNTISSLIPKIAEKKFLYCMINGGWEKCFENEFAYHLLNTLGFDDYWVSMQDNRSDIKIVNRSTNETTYLEIGHYTLNQSVVKESRKFKPIEDFSKREKQGLTNLYHIMLIESIQAEENALEFKYGLKIKTDIKHYLDFYPQGKLDFEVFSITNLKAFGYKINSYVILSYRN